MIRASLKFKVGFYIVIALTVAVFLFTFMVVRNNREELLQQAVSHTAQLSEVVIKSTRFAMLQNQASHVGKIIQDVGAQQRHRQGQDSKQERHHHSFIKNRGNRLTDRPGSGSLRGLSPG